MHMARMAMRSITIRPDPDSDLAPKAELGTWFFRNQMFGFLETNFSEHFGKKKTKLMSRATLLDVGF